MKYQENFVNTNKKLLKKRNRTLSVVRYFTWKLEFVSSNLWMIVSGNIFCFYLAPDPFKFALCNNFRNSKAFDIPLI